MLQLYDAYQQGKTSPLPQLTLQYSDFTALQETDAHREQVRDGLDYFKQHLVDAPATTTFPFDHPRPQRKSYIGGIVRLPLNSDLLQSLIALGRQNGTTLFVTLMTSFQIVLHRYLQQDRIVMGFPVAARDMEGIDQVVGMFTNTLPLQTNFAGQPTFLEMLNQVKEGIKNAREHRSVPLSELVNELGTERDFRVSPIYQVTFNNLRHPTIMESVFDMSGDSPKCTLSNGLTCTQDKNESLLTVFDLEVTTLRTDSSLVVRFRYDTDLFERDSVQRLSLHLQTLLEGIVKDPATRISDLPLLTAEERQQILIDWNSTSAEFPSQQSIHRLFEKQAALRPSAIAVIDQSARYTYQELNSRSNRMAAYLQELGVKPQDRIAVCVERSADLIVSILAILKTGSAYVPLDSDYPKDRLASIMENCAPTILITQSHLASRFPHDAPRTVCIDTLENELNRQPEENLTVEGDGESLAYIAYTSGSTGVPQGVCVPHRAVNRLVINTDYVPFGHDDVVAQASNVAFDAATFEIWGSLLNGGALTTVSKETLLSPEKLKETIEHQGITIMFMTPALFNQVARVAPSTFEKLNYLLLGGEALTPRWVKEVLNHGAPTKLLNGYGPTETTTFATTHRITHADADSESIPIGRPITNTQTYVLDEHLQPVPVGIEGELYIGGPGLALGYHNDPERTAERFVAHPFDNNPDARLYRSGDRVKLLPNGNLEFLGRRDFQVKMRGFRIELSEIETILEQIPGVHSAAVLMREEGPLGKHLAGYVATDSSDTTVESINETLGKKLPVHMIPATYSIMDSLPLNANGKIDRKALLKLEVVQQIASTSNQELQTETEQSIGLQWCDVFELESIDADANFFELGGHSLLAIELIANIRERLNIELSLENLFDRPTVRGLSHIADTKENASTNDETTPESNYVEMLRPGTTKTSFFCATGAGSVTGYYTPLASHLSSEQPFYGLKDPSLDSEAAGSYPAVEDLAARFVMAIREIQPHGPYRLGGWSFGGVVAFEMALQLIRKGEAIEKLIMLDAQLPPQSQGASGQTSKGKRDLGARISSRLKIMLNAWPLVLGYLRDAVKIAIRKLMNRNKSQSETVQMSEYFRWAWHDMGRQESLRKAGLASHNFSDSRLTMIEDPFVRLVFRTMNSRQHALRSYKPETYPDGLTIICGDNWNRESRPKLGWDAAVQGLIEVHEVPGSHEAFLEKPYVVEVARILQTTLDA